MENIRTKKLAGNFNKMFFVQAFQNIRTINVVAALFYLSRGLNLSEIFFLSIIWSVVNILFEVPSSYLADRWGRKRTIVLGAALYIVSYLWLIFADSFWILSVSVFFYALSNASFTGTDDALIYDTNREIGEEKDSLRRLGQYYSAERIFKVLSPLVGAFVARNLTQHEFMTLLIIDLAAAVVSFVICLSIIEPRRHYFEVEKVEAGVMRDAFKLVKNSPHLLSAICNRAFGFIGFFIIWRYHQELFTKIGAPVLALGIGWSLFHLILFIVNYFIHKFWPSEGLSSRINFLNFATVLLVAFFIVAWHLKINYYWLLLIYFFANFFENARWPIFSDLFNQYSSSFNRATTLSLSNFIKSVFDIPLLFITGLLVAKNEFYPVYFVFIIILISSIVFRLPKKLKFEKISLT